MGGEHGLTTLTPTADMGSELHHPHVEGLKQKKETIHIGGKDALWREMNNALCQL